MAPQIGDAKPAKIIADFGCRRARVTPGNWPNSTWSWIRACIDNSRPVGFHTNMQVLEMKTVHIGVAGWDDLKRSAKAAFRGERQGAHIDFASLELMHRVLTPNRWTMLKAMMGEGPMVSANWREHSIAMSSQRIPTLPPWSLPA